MIVTIVYAVFQIFTFAVIAYVLMSWIPALQNSSVGSFIAKIVEPYLEIFRKIIPPIGMIDISPIVALIALRFIQLGVLRCLAFLGIV